MSRKRKTLNVGIVGGHGAFIGHAHRMALHMGGTMRITCGALHQDPAVALAAGKDWPHDIKCYRDYKEMIAEERKRPLGERMDYVLIVTPNCSHFEIAKMCLENGFPVFCEKPLTMTVDEALTLERIANTRAIPFCVAHTYIGHWTTRLSRHIITSGLLGNVRTADAYYLQGWLADRLEATGQQQASWRTDPDQAGISCCGGDIGIHAFTQLEHVTGLKVIWVRAQLETFVKGRLLDDHFTTFCRMSNGASALVRASQIVIGGKNNLGILVAGDKGTLEWRQEAPEELSIYLPGQPKRTYYRGEVKPNDGFLKRVPTWLLKEPVVPSGHGEDFFTAFWRLHYNFAADVRRFQNHDRPIYVGERYPGVDIGVRGMKFVTAAVKSSEGDMSKEKL